MLTIKRQIKNHEEGTIPKCNLPLSSRKLSIDVIVPFHLSWNRIDGTAIITKENRNGISNLFVFFLKKGKMPPYVLKKSPDNMKYNGIRKKNIIRKKSIPSVNSLKTCHRTTKEIQIPLAKSINAILCFDSIQIWINFLHIYN